MPKCERRSSSLVYECYPCVVGHYHLGSNIKVYSLRVGRSKRTLGNSQMRLCPQGGLELSQMILRPLFLEHHDNVQDIRHINNKISRKQVLATPAGKE